MILLLGVAIIGDSRQPAARQSVVLQQDDSPARPGSTGPNLYASGDGRVYLSWVEGAGGNRHALRFAVRAGGKWSETRTVAEGENFFVNWADFPSMVALPDGTLAAHWLVKRGRGGHGYDVYIARSGDGGRTWSKPVVAHRDGTATEHGFVSMFPLPGGRVGAVWLDGRNFKEDSPGGHGSPADEMTLRYTTMDRKGQLSEEALLDPRVCDCCQTSAALTSEGAVVVYRDRSEKEVRDISVLRLHNGRWAAPRTLSAEAARSMAHPFLPMGGTSPSRGSPPRRRPRGSMWFFLMTPARASAFPSGRTTGVPSGASTFRFWPMARPSSAGWSGRRKAAR
ncbi:MAG TPA: sialidase family protein [Blastocatellia bacterium]|nr:sialidase family protein [Blastocatellia bacterium]